MDTYVIAYDVGTTGVKTCLFRIGDTINLVAGEMGGYSLYTMPDGGAEQDADEWWEAMCFSTKNLFKKTDVAPSAIAGISFCSQMQSLVLADKDGNAVRRPMSYMDQRARQELKDNMAYGVQIAGANVKKLLTSLKITGAVSASVKDPVYKYIWVKDHEPENFAKVYKWLDVKEYLIARCTGNFVMTQDSAFATLLYDTHKNTWSKTMCDMFGVDMSHMAKIIKCTDEAGQLSDIAATQLGLMPGTRVFGGGGDASLIGVGAGSTSVGDTHIYSGTSGWVSTVTDKQMVDTSAMIAAIVGADPGKYNYFAELETAGKCLEWVKDHLALDEIGIFLEHKVITEDIENMYESLYDYLSDVIDKVPAGSGGVIFTPWLHGNRCPFEDPFAAGMFFNISLDTGKNELIRSVIEGVCYHLRWMLEASDAKLKTSDVIRFVGGGALSDVTSQILSDVTGRTIETVASPQDVGAFGAAALIGVGTGMIPDIESVKNFIPAVKSFSPNAENKKIYDKYFKIFKSLYNDNKNNFKALNGET
jgi:xylulokinase